MAAEHRYKPYYYLPYIRESRSDLRTEILVRSSSELGILVQYLIRLNSPTMGALVFSPVTQPVTMVDGHIAADFAIYVSPDTRL